MKLSIIIPTLNEEDNIANLLSYLESNSVENSEIIVIDGGSKDQTIKVVSAFQKVKLIQTTLSSRAKQMNIGASRASNEVMVFLHADVLPPKSFCQDIKMSIEQRNTFGWFSYKFDPPRTLLKVNEFFTKLDGLFAGGGDQCFFIKKKIFEDIEGFNEKYSIMEDFELVGRLKKSNHKYCIIKKNATVSSRKYENNSWLRVNLVNLYAFVMFLLNKEPQSIKSFYQKALK